MNHRRSRLLAAILLSCFSAIVIGCGSVQSPHDGSAGGAGGTTGTGGGGMTGLLELLLLGLGALFLGRRRLA